MRRVVLLALLLAAPLVSRAQSPNVRDGYVTTDDGAKLYYRVAGAGRDTVIALHGGPGLDLESIYGDFAPLIARHTVIFYDQRGAGRSTLPSDTLSLLAPRQIADLEAVRAFFGAPQVILVAHSYGPLLAASYALAFPDHVKRMIFFGPVPPRRGEFWQRFGASMNNRMTAAQSTRLADAGRRLADTTADATAACRDYWAAAMPPRLAQPERSLPLIQSDLCASAPAGIRYGLTTTNRVVMESYGDWDLRARLAALRVPTLVIHGDDEAIPMDLVREWISAMPNARLLRIPHAAHFTYAEQPELVWPEVDRFIAGEWPPAAEPMPGSKAAPATRAKR
ncbi:MAG: alpha/beta hydrolase [Gemmatimonadaceae bacterium]